MKEAEATAKAAQEIAKTTAKGIDAARALGGFFNRMLGQGFEQVGGAFTDWAHVFRYQNALRLADKVEKINVERSLEGKTIPIEPRLAIPLIQKATQEDDDSILEMWAALMANATDPNRNIEAKRSFGSLLSELEPIDAEVLWTLYEFEQTDPERKARSQKYIQAHLADDGSPDNNEGEKVPHINVQWLSLKVSRSVKDLFFSVETLGRLGLVHDFMPDEGEPIPVPVTHKNADIALSYTALDLLRACSREAPPLDL